MTQSATRCQAASVAEAHGREEITLTRVREYAGRSLLALLAPLVLWGVAEGIAFLAGVEPLAEQRSYSARAQHRACQFQWRDADGLCRAGPLAHPGRELVVTLGGSSVFGYPPGRAVPLARPLGELLEAAAPGRWLAANRGFACKDTLFVRDCARNVLEAEPRVLVVYAGHNDFANWWPRPGRRIWLEEHAWLYDVERALAATRSFSLAARALGFSLGAPQRRRELPTPEEAESARAVVLEKFSANLAEVIEWSRQRGTDVILVTVVSNLHEFPVERADWDAGPARIAGTRTDLAPWREHFERGVSLHRAGRYAEAIAAFGQARDLLPRGRAHGALNERVRALSAALPNAHLVDFEQGLFADAGEAGIGCNFFGDEGYCDQFHPNGRTQALIARAVFLEMQRLGFVQ